MKDFRGISNTNSSHSNNSIIKKKKKFANEEGDSFLSFEKDSEKIQLERDWRSLTLKLAGEVRGIEVGDYSGSGTGGIIRWYGILFGRTK